MLGKYRKLQFALNNNSFGNEGSAPKYTMIVSREPVIILYLESAYLVKFSGDKINR